MRFQRKQLVNELISRKHNGSIKVITGLRRSGKSFLLFELFMQHLLDSGVDEEHIIAFSLEDRRNKALRDPDKCLSYIDGRVKDRGMYYVFIDEVQLMAEFEDVLNSYLNVPNVDVYVTGSNSKFLVTDVITEFRGRGDEVRVYPLSLSEYMEAFPSLSWEEAWSLYSNYGGLPKVALMDDDKQKRIYLKQLYKTTYVKDIVDRYSIKESGLLEQLISVVASAVGSLTNPLKLHNTFLSSGMKLSNVTIKQYLDYLKDAFLINEAQRYDVKGKHYIGSPYKYYFTDIGLRNALLNFRQYEETHLMENIIYMELLRRGCEVDVGVVEFFESVNLKRERCRLEIDFVVNNGSARYYIQSAYAMPSEDKIRQEERPLLKVADSFRKIIIVKEPVVLWHNNNGTTIMSLKQFLTDENSLNL